MMQHCILKYIMTLSTPHRHYADMIVAINVILCLFTPCARIVSGVHVANVDINHSDRSECYYVGSEHED